MIKALNTEGLEVKKIPSGTTSVLQPPDVSVNKPFKNGIRKKWDKWICDGEREFTKNGNRRKASYELVCRWVSEVWKEISPELLIKSFEASGLTLNPDGSEDNRMSSRLQAIVENRMDDDVLIEESSEEEPIANESDCEDNYEEPDEDDEFDEEINVDEFDEVSDNEFDKKISDDESDKKIDNEFSDDEFDENAINEFSDEEITYNEFDDKEFSTDETENE